MSCLFCNREFDPDAGRDRTAEHILGNWLQPHFESPDEPGTQHRWNASKTGEEETWSYSAYPADRTVQGVCRECNNDWLSPIEDAAKPYLLPALQSRKRRRSFGEDAQDALSIWAYKTALVVGVKGGHAQIPVSHLHDFYESRSLPASTRAWIAATTGRDLLYLDHRTITVGIKGEEAPTESNAFATTIGVGHIGLHVLRWTGPKPDMSPYYAPPLGSQLIPIFPTRGPVIWPPADAFTKDGFDQFANVFGSVRDSPLP